MGNLFSRRSKSSPQSPPAPKQQPQQQQQQQQQRGSISTVYNPAQPSANPRPSPAHPATASRSVSPPVSSPGTPNTHLPLSVTPALPTIPTLLSPLNGRVVSAEASPSSAVDDGGSEEVSRSGEDAKDIALDPRVDSGADVAYSFWNRNSREATYRPPERGTGSRLGQTVRATMKATLGGGDIMDTVKLPEGEDPNEWIAVNTVHFFNAASMIWGACSSFCTQQSCPLMTAGRAEYLWKDDALYKKPTRLSAHDYIELLLAWVDSQISDPAIFPVEDGARFPRNFSSVVRNIYKRLFRLYAHLYCHHADRIKAIGANAHLNTCFKHFIYFVLEFQLMDKADLAPLDRLIVKMRENDSRNHQPKPPTVPQRR